MQALPTIPVPAPACSAPPVPTGPCPVCPRLAADFEPWRQAAYWQALPQRAVQREQRLQQEVHTLQARVRDLEQRLFGRRTEAVAVPAEADPSPPPAAPPPRPRRQQRGRPGPRRRDHSHLPAVEETIDLPGDQRQCPRCGQAFAPFLGTDDSTVLEVEVRAHRRLIRRRRYRPACGCGCGCNPGIVTAPPPPEVLPKSTLGVSIWVRVLLDKYLFYRPTYRLPAELATEGLDLSPGTITDGLRRLPPLLEPLYDALVERSRAQTLWYADETRWLVFAAVEGKVGHRWFLWVFHGGDVVVFVLAGGRAHDVPEEHLGPLAEGILVVNRHAAYKALPQVQDGRIVLAFCRAHVRRDFVEAARAWPELQGWALGWVERIGALYHADDALRAARDDPAAFARADRARQGEVERHEDDLHPARRKILRSLHDHRPGLTVFVGHPDVPMDNNTAERARRGPVVGRKNYYGSGAEWGGRLAALLFSLFQTLALANLNPRLWRTAYLGACAGAGGRAPADATAYLPWNLTDEHKRAWQ